MTNEELIEAMAKAMCRDNMTVGPLLRTQAMEAFAVAENEIKERLIKLMEFTKKHIESSLSGLDPSFVEETKDYTKGMMDAMDEVSGAIGQLNISDEIRKLK